jgi:hypothetical protein
MPWPYGKIWWPITGFQAGYFSVQRFVRRLRGNQPAQACAVICTPVGEEAQVDYGNKGPMVRDERTGKYRRTRLFVLTLGYSRKAVRLLTFQSSSRIWAELHEKRSADVRGQPVRHDQCSPVRRGHTRSQA